MDTTIAIFVALVCGSIAQHFGVLFVLSLVVGALVGGAVLYLLVASRPGSSYLPSLKVHEIVRGSPQAIFHLIVDQDKVKQRQPAR